MAGGCGMLPADVWRLTLAEVTLKVEQVGGNLPDEGTTFNSPAEKQAYREWYFSLTPKQKVDLARGF